MVDLVAENLGVTGSGREGRKLQCAKDRDTKDLEQQGLNRKKHGGRIKGGRMAARRNESKRLHRETKTKWTESGIVRRDRGTRGGIATGLHSEGAARAADRKGDRALHRERTKTTRGRSDARRAAGGPRGGSSAKIHEP